MTKKRKRPQGAASRGGRPPSPWSDSEAKCWRRHPMCPRSHRRATAPPRVQRQRRRLPATFVAEGACSDLLLGIDLAAFAALAAALAALRCRLLWAGKRWSLRLGKLNRVKFPRHHSHLEHVIITVDQRIIATPFRAERTPDGRSRAREYRRGTVLGGWDAEKACVEAGGLLRGHIVSAQTFVARGGGTLDLWPRWHCGGTSSTRRSRSTSRKRHPLGALISSP